MFATIATPVRNCLNLRHGAKWCQYISFTLYAIAAHSELLVSAQTLPNLTQFQVTKFQTYTILIKRSKKN